MSGKLTFWQLYKEATGKLDESRLGEALPLLQELADALGDWKLLDEVSDVNSAYGLLLYYMEQGNDDPARERQRTNFIAACYCIAEKAAQAQRAKQGGAGQGMRSLGDILKDMENLALKSITSEPSEADSERHAALYAELFDAAYDAPLWSLEAAAQAQEVIDSAFVSDNDKAVMTSGLMMSCLQSFDPRKLLFFADNYSAAMPLLRVRMLAAAAFTLYAHRRRLFAFPAVTGRYRELCGSPRFASDIRTFQILIIESLSTHEVNRRMREEIIPAMLKNRSFNPAKFDAETLEEISESNPEWKDFERQVGKLAELEAGGADIYFSSFSPLKKFPFFRIAANWLYPFDERHPGIPRQITRLKGIAAAMLKSDTLCDSDKYSFCLLAAQMTDKQVSLVVSQLPETEGLPAPAPQTPESLCRNYLRCLFRFFYLCTSKPKPGNPFETALSLLECGALAGAFNDKDTADRISSCAIKKGRFGMAAAFLLLNEASGAADAETYQKLGFCCQKKKDYRGAIAAYKKASALDGGSRWTLQRLAQTFRAAGDYKEALGCYRLLEAADGKDAKNAFRCGECLAAIGSYSEALREFFKAEYLDPSLVPAARAIAWCSMITGDMKQARKYYGKIPGEEKQGADLMNAGHAAWMDGDLKAAAECYRAACGRLGQKEFLSKMQTDAALLETRGIPSRDILLMTDIAIRGNG